MSGRIQTLVATVVLGGIRKAAPEAIANAAAVDALLASGPDGIPLGPYRRFLDEALTFDGGIALLQCGAPLRELSHPLLFVMLNSDAPRLVIDKEARLAAFFHSRHRVVVEHEGERSMTLRHTGPPGEPPEPAEDLATLGQHIALLEEIGCRGLRARLPDSGAPEVWVYDDGALVRPTPGSSFARWHLEWDAFSAVRKRMPGLDETLLAALADRELTEGDAVAARVEAVVRRDLARTWRVSEVAEALKLSPRSLQRALAADGERYSDLVDRIRNLEAARLLEQSTLSLTEIGYVCGFSDSAHFSRSFKKRFGASPSDHRSRGT